MGSITRRVMILSVHAFCGQAGSQGQTRHLSHFFFPTHHPLRLDWQGLHLPLMRGVCMTCQVSSERLPQLKNKVRFACTAERESGWYPSLVE